MANYVKTLEARYTADQKNAQLAAKARQEGEMLQKANKIPDAIAKYKEYLRYAPNDTAMANYVKSLEASHAASHASTGGTGRVYTAKPVETPSGGTQAAGSWTGAWKSSAGPEGEVVSFNLTANGTRLTGNFSVTVSYKTSSGSRQTDTIGGPLEGTISGNTAKGTFRDSSDARNSGTFTFTMAPGGNQFACTVRAQTGESRTYTVQRSR